MAPCSTRIRCSGRSGRVPPDIPLALFEVPTTLEAADHFHLEAVVLCRGRVLAATRDLEVLRFARIDRARDGCGVLIDEFSVLEQVGPDLYVTDCLLSGVRGSAQNPSRTVM